ncbi:alpha-hydroxyketone-type quorum-sensing autoinducer synthase [Halomonas organivorans]|uniref:CAI-1 autoinducer synthase n=1 Tax=Halomonas organivorans TaxID=257772 RepID=A0A7W5C148_9GAMM|nr:alpha-hydroxyketone-type quorum-sensing autoinducer synthase [Halomonas organivorans]MBB3141898.1 CAI-1 autoinducer synthase [Halomonas organivorans]
MGTDAKTVLPDIFQERLDRFAHDLIEQNDNGKHLVLGKRPSRNDIVLQSNDYLCLANHTSIQARLKGAIEKSQDSVFMSAVFLQDEASKPGLEHQLADYVDFESCLLSQSGWNANAGLLQTVCPPGCNVYIDFFAHMSMWEGARYANASIHPFLHNSCDHLIKQIKRHGPGLIAVDSIYSTIGTVAPLVDLVKIAKDNGCAILVDESHSLGTHGEKGAGLLSELGLSRQVDFMTASLAKTFAYRAGAIWVNNSANQCIPFVGFPAIFSSCILPYEIEVIEETLDIVKKSDERRSRLFNNSRMLVEGLKGIGVETRSQSQIVALETGERRNTEKVRDHLEDSGVFGAVFCSPATAEKKNLIRFSLNSSVTDAQIDHILSVCQGIANDSDLFIKTSAG